MPEVRPDWDPWALGITKAIAERGDCTRRQVGALILDKGHGPVSFGYNGTYPGGPSCLKGECPRGRHYKLTWNPESGDWECKYPADLYHPESCVSVEACACGRDWPCPDAVAPGSSYDTGSGKCESVHAEVNALLQVSDRSRLVESTMYITDAPCDGCLKIIKNTAISRIVWPEGEYVK